MNKLKTNAKANQSLLCLVVKFYSLERIAFSFGVIMEKSSTEGLFFNPYGDGIGGYIRVRFRESIPSPKRNSKSQEKVN
jgi:hypothetical protein